MKIDDNKKKKINSLLEKIDNFSNKVSNWANKETNAPEKVKFKLFQTLKFSYANLLFKGKDFFKLSWLFVLYFVVIDFIFARPYICRFDSKINIGFDCATTSFAIYAPIICKIFITSLFATIWYHHIRGRDFSTKELFQVTKQQLIVFAMILVAVIVFLIPFLSVYILIIRTPIYDITTELTIFAIISTGFLAPILVVRLFIIFPYFIENNNLSSFKELWNKTYKNTIKILTAFLVIAIILNIRDIINTSEQMAFIIKNPIFASVFLDIYWAIIYFIFISIATNLSIAMYDNFYKGE